MAYLEVFNFALTLPKFTKAEKKNLKYWFKARDYFLGRNGKTKNISQALELAKLSNHQDALWLCNIFPDSENFHLYIDTTALNFKICFKFAELKDDPRALCFYGIFIDDINRVKLSAELGYYFAQIQIFGRKFLYRDLILNLSDPELLVRLAEYYSYKNDLANYGESWTMMHDCYKLSAELGYRNAMYSYGCLLDVSDPRRYYWQGKAAQNLYKCDEFILEAAEQLTKFYSKRNIFLNSDPNRGKVIFQIGDILKDCIQDDYGEVFGNPSDLYISMREIVYSYDKWCEKAREAILCWMLISKKLPIHKDLRKVIAKLVWAKRIDADYVILSNLQK